MLKLRNASLLRFTSAFVFSMFLFNAIQAIEIPLEALGKATNIAYVNMYKIFEAFPETESARVELNRQIDDKKAEITLKKEEIAKLKADIEFLRKKNSAVTNPKLQSSWMESENPDNKKDLTLPENSPLNFIFAPPEDSTSTAVAPEEDTKNNVQVSTSGPQILPGIPSLAPQLSDKETLLSQKQADLEAFVGAAEEEIRNMEEGKTMTLLARIYKGMEEVAAREGYSVVLDRDNILYGDKAIDITEQVIWRLSARP